MKPRRKPYGDKNICGEVVEKIRKERGIRQSVLIQKMQLLGIDINPSSYSKLEGQNRIATDRELWAISQILGVPMDDLVSIPEE